MTALEHAYAKSRITRGNEKSNEPNEKPIHYLSHKLTASQTNWPTIEKEAFAIFYALQTSDQYLLDSEFVIRTDHKPLKYIMDPQYRTKRFKYVSVDFLFCFR